MPRFFTDKIYDNKAEIFGEDASHIVKSLRMGAGDVLELCDLKGFDYKARILEASSGLVTAEIIEKRECETEPAVKLSLFQALPKSDKLEIIAQKAVELGVYEITPVITSRCVSRWDEKTAQKKTERIGKIMFEAAKQSGRGIIPRMNRLLGFEEAILRMKSAECAILFYECATRPLREILCEGVGRISLMIGSEGGFSKEEAELAEENGVCTASLGPRILRCETAPITALSVINYAMGEFG